MSPVRAINARILAIIDKRSGAARLVRVATTSEHLALTFTDGSQHEIPWADLTQIVALRRRLYTYDQLSLRLEYLGPGVLEIAESCQGWSDLCTAINELFEGAKPFIEWYAEALSAPADTSIDIWARRR